MTVLLLVIVSVVFLWDNAGNETNEIISLGLPREELKITSSILVMNKNIPIDPLKGSANKRKLKAFLCLGFT